MTASLTKESMRNGESESAKFPMTLCYSSIFWARMKDLDELHQGPDSNLLSDYSTTPKGSIDHNYSEKTIVSNQYVRNDIRS